MKKTLCIIISVLLIAASIVTLCACDNREVILIWGASDHQDIYLEYAEKFREAHIDQLKDYKFEFAGSGDSGAYSAMQTDPSAGAAVYTFANDMMANLINLGALAPVLGDNLAWSEENNIEAAVEATYMGGKSYAYPLQADNGYYMYYNKDAFKDTAVWDSATNGLKADYTFRDLYAALDEKGGKWADGKVTWSIGDSWYTSGVFFSVGGDYKVTYDADGKQESAACWFSYTLPDGITDPYKGDYTIGMDAYECLKNSITVSNTDNTVSKHYLYSDAQGSHLNDNIDNYTNPDNTILAKTPLAAVICGTWKAAKLKEVWGDNYAATILPTLETDDGEMFAMKNFAGYKHIGVNPQCTFAKSSEANLMLLHELAQYLSDTEVSIARYESTGAGPANKKALENEKVATDSALLALNAQYARECKYPANYSIAELRGQPVGNGLGFRVQDAVPANYWAPIDKFGNTLYNEFANGKLDRFKDYITTKDYLAELQSEIEQAAQ